MVDWQSGGNAGKNQNLVKATMASTAKNRHTCLVSEGGYRILSDSVYRFEGRLRRLFWRLWFCDNSKSGGGGGGGGGFHARLFYHIFHLEQTFHGLGEVFTVAFTHEIFDIFISGVLVALQLVLAAPQEQMQARVLVLCDGRDESHAHEVVEPQLLLDLFQRGDRQI